MGEARFRPTALALESLEHRPETLGTNGQKALNGKCGVSVRPLFILVILFVFPCPERQWQTVLQNLPTRFSSFAIGFPQTTTPEKCISVIASLHSTRQLLYLFHVATTQDNGIGDEREL
jgi:hypothetical protein